MPSVNAHWAVYVSVEYEEEKLRALTILTAISATNKAEMEPRTRRLPPYSEYKRKMKITVAWKCGSATSTFGVYGAQNPPPMAAAVKIFKTSGNRT